MKYVLSVIIFALPYLLSSSIAAQTSSEWPMVGANVERTSWIPTETKGSMSPEWYRPIEPYINMKTQLIIVNDTIYVSTAKGLYALTLEGNQKWIYGTELPLGNAPTYHNGTLYVGGYDRRLHAIDATTGKLKSSWQFNEADAGFETNPLIINNTAYLGSRDGFFYAFDISNGSIKWKFKTEGPILFSAAYKEGVLYFASNDSHAYAVNANTGSQVWKSNKLPGQGFHSYWPVVYKDYVIVSGSRNYRYTASTTDELGQLFPNRFNESKGTPIGTVGTASGDWATGTITIDAQRIIDYYEQMPWRRAYFILHRSNGTEKTFDIDTDGKTDYAPIAFSGTTHSGNKYPPSVGPDGVLYQFNTYKSDRYISGGGISGWTFGSRYISVIADGWNIENGELKSAGWKAVDEPMGYTISGSVLHWNLNNDRGSGSFDTAIPWGQSIRSWGRHGYNLNKKAPGFEQLYYANDQSGWGLFGGQNGVYAKHGVQNPPIPYKGKIYTINANNIMAWSTTGTATQPMPLLPAPASSNNTPTMSLTKVQQSLEKEVTKMIAAGHLRIGHHSIGIADIYLNRSKDNIGDKITDYFSNPAETHITLLRALPYLNPSLQAQTKQYLQEEFAKYPIHTYAYIGHRDGAQREVFDIPPDLKTLASGAYESASTLPKARDSRWWTTFTPYSFYGAYRYAAEFGGAKEMLDTMRNKLDTPPADAELIERPHNLNAFIAGYFGFIELQKLVGETPTSSVVQTYNRLLDLRMTTFSKDTPYIETREDFTYNLWSTDYRRSLNIARNFMYMTPELANEMRERIPDKVDEALDEYMKIAPGWFVTKYDANIGEGSLDNLHNYHSIFQANARIRQLPASELSKYVDVPAFARGDLFYIDNLVATLENSSITPFPTTSVVPTSTVSPGQYFISNVTPSNYQVELLSIGSLVYVDRTFTYSAIPNYLNGQPYIQTANDDKQQTGGNFLRFTVNEPSRVYISMDTRVTPLPDWLTSFTKSNDTVSYDSSSNPFQLYYKDLPAGEVILGANNGQSSSTSMYTVIIAPSGQTVTSGDTDGDGDVDIFDYNTVLSNFGKSVTGPANGDLDGDDDVDIFDYNAVISNFGK